MPEGPFGLPRLTDKGPFASDNIEVRFNEEVHEDASIPPEFNQEVQKHGWDDKGRKRIIRRVMIKQKPDESVSGIMESLKESVASLGERAAMIDYYTINEGIAYINKTEVDRRFRRKGVASELRQTSLDDMSDRGISIVYTFPVTDSGEALARSQGFVESDIAGFMEKDL